MRPENTLFQKAQASSDLGFQPAWGVVDLESAESALDLGTSLGALKLKQQNFTELSLPYVSCNVLSPADKGRQESAQ